MECNNIPFHKILDVFADVELERLKKSHFEDPLEHLLQAPPKIFKARREISMREMLSLSAHQHQFGNIDCSEQLKHLDISPIQAFLYNESMMELIRDMFVEMVKQGVVICQIENITGDALTSQMTLTVSAINPPDCVKRLSVSTRDKY